MRVEWVGKLNGNCQNGLQFSFSQKYVCIICLLEREREKIKIKVLEYSGLAFNSNLGNSKFWVISNIILTHFYWNFYWKQS